jgi:aryl-alcohol dehydrogenase-like predicted oxidoreductase
VNYINFGSTGVKVSRLAIGTATFGVRPLAENVNEFVGRTLDLGINLFDCSNSYGHQPRFDREGAPPADQREPSEILLGRALGSHRHDVVLCTKVMEPVGPGVNDRGLSRKHINQQLEQSLRRFGTDYIDVYYAHHPDPTTPIEQTVRTFDDLIHQGKIRYWALSTFMGWQQMEALWTADRLGLNPPAAHQVTYNLANRAVERDIVPVSLKYGMGMTVFSPLAGGLLAGLEVLERPVTGGARWGGRGFTEEQIILARQLDTVAKKYGYPSAQLALGWLLARPGVSSAIIGPENIHELEVNIEAGSLELPAEVMEAVDEIGRPPPVFGRPM